LPSLILLIRLSGYCVDFNATLLPTASMGMNSSAHLAQTPRASSSIQKRTPLADSRDLCVHPLTSYLQPESRSSMPCRDVYAHAPSSSPAFLCSSTRPRPSPRSDPAHARFTAVPSTRAFTSTPTALRRPDLDFVRRHTSQAGPRAPARSPLIIDLREF
jgi:hypothetical protein